LARKPENEKTFRKAKVGGRPCKLTPETQDKIIQYLRRGAYVETAAAAAGVNKETFYDWLRQGAAKPDSKFGEFSDAVDKAQAESEVNDLEVITKAAEKGNWNASAWRLERKNPGRWGYAKRNEVDEQEDDTKKPTTDIKLNYSLRPSKKGMGDGNE
jgi:transposase